MIPNIDLAAAAAASVPNLSPHFSACPVIRFVAANAFVAVLFGNALMSRYVFGLFLPRSIAACRASRIFAIDS